MLSSRVYPEFFTMPPSARVLNAGFGDGPQVLAYQGRYASMTGIDIQPDRLARAEKMLRSMGIANVELRAGNVEATGLDASSVDVVLAIDIVEHVQDPEKFLREMYRVLAPGGKMLITYPAMHDRFEEAMNRLGRILKPWKKRAPHPEGWHPDHHAHEYPVAKWRAMTEQAGFHFVRSRATTLFPPLHLYGIPRFWFRVEWLHALDRRLCDIGALKPFGQTVMMVFEKSLS